MVINIIKIKKEVKKFRRAINKCDKSKMPIVFKYFPHGSCEDTTLILGEYLNQKKLGNYKCISGETEYGLTHAWLEIEDYVIDITSDQFINRPEVFISKNTRWYRKFIHKKEVYKIINYDKKTRRQLFMVLNYIKKIIRKF